MVCKVEVCEEAGGAEGEGEDGRDDALEEPGCEEDGAVASELCISKVSELNFWKRCY